MVLAGPLVFTNLYFEHDYYEAAISPAVAAIIGLACSRATRQRLIGAAAAWIVALAVSAPVWAVAYDARADPEAVLPVAKQIAARTSSDELVAVVGRGWDPSALYYARRRGYAVPVGQTPNLDGYRVFVSTPGSRVVTEIP